MIGRIVDMGGEQEHAKIGQGMGCKDPCCSGHINTLTTIAPESLNTVHRDGWEEIELTVDSGRVKRS